MLLVWSFCAGPFHIYWRTPQGAQPGVRLVLFKYPFRAAGMFNTTDPQYMFLDKFTIIWQRNLHFSSSGASDAPKPLTVGVNPASIDARCTSPSNSELGLRTEAEKGSFWRCSTVTVYQINDTWEWALSQTKGTISRQASNLCCHLGETQMCEPFLTPEHIFFLFAPLKVLQKLLFF